MPPISHPIPVVLCGKTTEIGKLVSELLLPEYEVIYFIQSFEAAKTELPHLIAGREPQSPFPNEIGTHKYGRPARAVIFGRAFDPSQVEQLVNMCVGPETVAWVAGDPAKKSDRPYGPNYANVASQEVKDALGKWVSEGCVRTETILY